MSRKPLSGYWVYIARMRDGRLYVGHTNNIARRPRDHFRGNGGRTTKVFGFNALIYRELLPDLASAVKRENQLKGWSHAKKRALAEGNALELKRLSRSKKTRSMREFLIKRTDGDWFDLHATRFAEVLKPNSFPSRPTSGWGDHRIEVLGCEVSFSYEDPGIQVCFERGPIPDDQAKQIVREILENITRSTGQPGNVIEIT